MPYRHGKKKNENARTHALKTLNMPVSIVIVVVEFKTERQQLYNIHQSR